MPCGCGCPKCRRQAIAGSKQAYFVGNGPQCDAGNRRCEVGSGEDYVSRDVRDTPPPLADWFTSPRMTLPREPEREQHESTLTLAAWEVAIPHSEWIGPKDTYEPALSINDAYAHRLLRVRQTVPSPEWQHATGFSTIASRQVEALDTVHYSFAAMDTGDLVDEVYRER